jgi:hypothetical protein
VYRKKIDITFDGFELQEMKILGLDHTTKRMVLILGRCHSLVCLVIDQTTNA